VPLNVLQTVLSDEDILEGCGDTGDAVARLCLAFRESGRFARPIAYQKIGALLEIDPKTVGGHWAMSKSTGSQIAQLVARRFLLLVNSTVS
jgi:hypothetical protein